MPIFFMLLVYHLLVSVGCALVKYAPVRPIAKAAPVVEGLLNHQLGQDSPLSGSWSQGTRIFRTGRAASEAQYIFRTSGVTLLFWCGQRCKAPGVDSDGNSDGVSETAGRIYIPGTNPKDDVASFDYQEASKDFSIRFNRAMVDLTGN